MIRNTVCPDCYGNKGLRRGTGCTLWPSQRSDEKGCVCYCETHKICDGHRFWAPGNRSLPCHIGDV